MGKFKLRKEGGRLKFDRWKENKREIYENNIE